MNVSRHDGMLTNKLCVFAHLLFFYQRPMNITLQGNHTIQDMYNIIDYKLGIAWMHLAWF